MTPLTLGSGDLTQLNDVVSFLTGSIGNFAPRILFATLAVFGIILLFRYVPKWVRAFMH